MEVEPPGTDSDDPRARAVTALYEAIRFLDRGLQPRQKVQAFARAAEIAAGLDPIELTELAETETLTALDGIGPSTASVIADAVLGRPCEYLDRLDAATAVVAGPGAAIRAALRGDCHSHTSWSDGGAPLHTMASAARALGHEYLVVTDHSPRLTVAHGLSPDRLRQQLDDIEVLNERLAPFRLLTGLEVDILVDGSLDLPEDLLARLDVVVASVHSKLSMPSAEMTRRMILAVVSPHVDILGHCTGRMVSSRSGRPGGGGGRPPSEFDADLVFAACAEYGTAVEINCRPERQDPPDELLAAALEWGCLVSINTDAHSPGQLEWQPYGCDKAARCAVPTESIINTWSADELVGWARSDRAA